MSNMSYCRFRNTLSDLGDCQDALFEELFDLSPEEERARLREAQQTHITLGDARREVQRWHWHHLLDWLHLQFSSGVTPDELLPLLAA